MQRDEALRLTREWLLLAINHRREEALRALRALSTAEDEEETLLHAYQLYGDEFVAWALGGASARMLPVLYEQLRRWPVGCAEYGGRRAGGGASTADALPPKILTTRRPVPCWLGVQSRQGFPARQRVRSH